MHIAASFPAQKGLSACQVEATHLAPAGWRSLCPLVLVAARPKRRPPSALCRSGCISVPAAAVMKFPKLSDVVQHKVLLLHFFESEMRVMGLMPRHRQAGALWKPRCRIRFLAFARGPPTPGSWPLPLSSKPDV